MFLFTATTAVCVWTIIYCSMLFMLLIFTVNKLLVIIIINFLITEIYINLFRGIIV